MVQKIKVLGVLGFLFLFGFACTKKSNESETPKSESPAASTAKELRIFAWSEYFDDALIHKFEEETGAKVKADYFSSNEQMFTKLQLTMSSSDAGYDLILPSDYMVRILVQLKMLKAIDKSKLPFLQDFDPAMLNPSYDPNLQFSVPMAYGISGVAINTKLLPKFSKISKITWKEIFESPEYANKVTLLDDAKEVLQVALFLQGKNMESAQEADLKAAFEYLKKHKKQVKAFTAETRPVIEANECAICMAYSGDVLSVAKSKPEIKFLVPTDGATKWADNFAIPTNAKSVDLAYKFIEKVLSAEGAKEFTQRTGYRTGNQKAKALISSEVLKNPAVYPDPSVEAKMSFLIDHREFSTLIDKEWTALKSQ